jgi:hypothetical protein
VAYEASEQISGALAALDPTEIQAQRDHSLSLNRLGDIRGRQGDTEGALEAFRRTEHIRSVIALANPLDVRAQVDQLAVWFSLCRLNAMEFCRSLENRLPQAEEGHWLTEGQITSIRQLLDQRP